MKKFSRCVADGCDRSMARYTKEGAKLWKRVEIRVILLDAKIKGLHYKAKPARGRMYTESDIDAVLLQIAEDCEKRYPTKEFLPVKLATNVYNFVEQEKKAVPICDSISGEG